MFLPGQQLGPYEIRDSSSKAEWAKSISPATRASAAI